MLTEEELGNQIGARLRAEVTGLDIRHDTMIRAIRRRRARTAATVRGSVAIAATAALAVTAVGLSAGQPAPAGPTPTRAPARSSAVRIQLDGYLVSMPAGTPVEKAGPGYRIGSRADGFIMVLFLASGPDIASQAAQAASPGYPAERVQAGSMTGWWVGESYGGVLWLQPPALPHSEYLLAKVFGPAEAKALAFASRLNVSRM